MIIITGASKGIGLYLFNHFRSSGKEVIGTYNSSKSGDNMYKVNISNAQEVEAFANQVKDKLVNIVLINCAGANYSAFAHKADLKKWSELIHVNLIGTFYMINAILPLMRHQNYGRIINFSSVVAQVGVPGTSAYAASKAGLWGLTKAISSENASKGITINNLNLGYFKIGMINEVPSEIQNTIKNNIPIKDFGDPHEILRAVEYLISSNYITGTSLDLNGGLI